MLQAIDGAPCDDDGRPLQNIRIRHTIVLDDPTPDPRGLEEHVPEASPEPQVGVGCWRRARVIWYSAMAGVGRVALRLWL